MLERHVDPRLAEARVLLAGDSHAETGFDVSRWDRGLNVALRGEPLVATLHKLRFLTPRAPALEEIVVSVGPQSIARFRDGHLEGGPGASRLLERLYGVMPFWTLGDTPVSRELAFAASLRKWWSPDLHLIQDQFGRPAREHPYANGFVPREGSDLSDETFHATMSMHYPEGDPRTSTIQMRMLDSIVDHGRAAGVRVTLVRTPLHARYRQAVPGPVQVALDSLLDTYRREGSARVVDLHQVPFADSLFSDFNHLTGAGARVLSDMIVAADPSGGSCPHRVPLTSTDGTASRC